MTDRLVDEQPPPHTSQGDVWLLVMQDMENRRVHGIEKYGVPVQPHNGRDALVDAYQEALDLCVYLRQAIEERSRLAAAMTRLRKIVENGEEWDKVSASSLHLIITDIFEAI